jgi:hypothetical protein
MRAYLPLAWPDLRRLHEAGQLDGPTRACVVDPAWRRAAPEVDEEQWEYEALSLAATALGSDGGLVLAVEAQPTSSFDDGWCTVAGAISTEAVHAMFSERLEWYGIQELGALLPA